MVHHDSRISGHFPDIFSDTQESRKMKIGGKKNYACEYLKTSVHLAVHQQKTGVLQYILAVHFHISTNQYIALSVATLPTPCTHFL